MQKIKNIEFLRVIGCITIILYHLFLKSKLYYPDIDLYNKLHNMTACGGKAVELFFILSGFFFVYTLNTNKTCWEFIKSKLIRLYPVLVFVIILYFIFSLTGTLKFTLYDNIFTLLGLNGTGLIIKYANASHFWYVSAMLWTLLFYFYLNKNYEKKNINLFIVLTVFFSYTFLLHVQKGNIGGIERTYNTILNVGMLRALGGISIGYLIGEWYKNNIDNINSLKVNIYQTIALSGLEFITIYFIINNLMLHKLNYNNQFIFIIAYTIIIMLFLAKKGFFSKILDNNIWVQISKYSYSIYMIHFPIYYQLKACIWDKHPGFIYTHPVINFVGTILLVIMAGILTYHLIEKPCVDYFKRKSKAEQTIDVKSTSNPCGGGVIDLFAKCFYSRIPLNTI